MYGILKTSSYTTVLHFLHCQDGTYYLDWLLALFECLMLGWNCCLRTNSHWAYLSCNLEFSVMQMRLDIGLLPNYLSVHFEHCWMEIRTLFLNCTNSTVLFVGSAEILRNNLTGSVRLKELKWSEFGDLFQVIVILVSVRSLVGKLKAGRKPKSDQNFE